MKKTITTLAFALTILASSAQERVATGQCASKPTSDAKLISTTVVGDYEVRKWLIPQSSTDDANNEFSVRYQINISRMISSYDNNSKEVAGLRDFINEITADSNKSISRINICGYASPDGGMTANERLATARAVDCRNYINKEFNLSKYPGQTKGIAQPWSATEQAVEKSSIPNKAAVLKLVESSQSDTMIESKLKEMDSSWAYMAKNILPPMRCVEIEVVYTGWESVETRTLIAPEVVEEVVVEENNYFIIFTERPSDIYTFSNPAAAPLDFNNCKEYKYYRKGLRGHIHHAGRGHHHRGRYNDGRNKYIFKEKRNKEKMKSDSRGFFQKRRSKVKYR